MLLDMTPESFVAAPETVLVPLGRPSTGFFAVPQFLAAAREHVAADAGLSDRLISDLARDRQILLLSAWRTADDVVATFYDFCLTPNVEPKSMEPDAEGAVECLLADGTRAFYSHRVASLLWGHGAGKTIGEWLCAPDNGDAALYDLVDELVADLPHMLANGIAFLCPLAVESDDAPQEEPCKA